MTQLADGPASDISQALVKLRDQGKSGTSTYSQKTKFFFFDKDLLKWKDRQSEQGFFLEREGVNIFFQVTFMLYVTYSNLGLVLISVLSDIPISTGRKFKPEFGTRFPQLNAQQTPKFIKIDLHTHNKTRQAREIFLCTL